jgi:ketosteroid isomerase-like protein
MSQQNVILTRQAYDAFTRRDIDAFLRILDPDVEMFISRLAPVEGESQGEVPLDWTLWQIGRWRGGKLVWMHSADTRAAVLEAAGLSEQDAHADS